VTGTRDLSVCFLNSGPACVFELLLWLLLLIWPLLVDPPDLRVYFFRAPPIGPNLISYLFLFYCLFFLWP
jgi:hypothetical protein